jgi:hypothetical protein
MTRSRLLKVIGYLLIAGVGCHVLANTFFEPITAAHPENKSSNLLLYFADLLQRGEFLTFGILLLTTVVGGICIVLAEKLHRKG